MFSPYAKESFAKRKRMTAHDVKKIEKSYKKNQEATGEPFGDESVTGETFCAGDFTKNVREMMRITTNETTNTKEALYMTRTHVSPESDPAIKPCAVKAR